METDEARRALAETLASEAALATRNEAITREIADARQRPDIFDRETFSAWLARMRSEQTRLTEPLRGATMRTAANRAVLANRRMAETAADEALGRAVTARESAVARRDQAMLEDVARALTRAPVSDRDNAV